jgi:hypothetical protein
MTYVHISHVPGQTLDDFRAVEEALGNGKPDGQLLTIVGAVDGALHIVDVWTSRAHADRFAAERLFPAFQQTGIGPSADATYVAFEADAIEVGEGFPAVAPTAP